MAKAGTSGMIETRRDIVTLARGGSIVVNIRNGSTLGKTKKGQEWRAHSIFWGPGKEPQLWMLDPQGFDVGAWANLSDVVSGAEAPVRFE